MRRQGRVPIEFWKWAVKSNRYGAAFLVVKMKLTEGKRVNPRNYSKKDLESLRRLNLIGYSVRKDAWWQRSWKEIGTILGFDPRHKQDSTITLKDLVKYRLKDLIYAIGVQYLLRMQDGRNLKGIRHLQPSAHNGGIAHSLVTRFFGKSLNWSVLRRKSCHSCGLLKFRRRRSDAPQVAAVAPNGKAYRYADITSAVTVRVEFKFSVPRELRVRRFFDRKEGAYVPY